MSINGLKSITQIFENSLFRIPDYQRGYAWDNTQLEDYWNDLRNLADSKIHYTGVLTIKIVDIEIQKKWEEDTWIMEGKGYTPFYIVDGQQRLTTTIILIQSILDKMVDDKRLNYYTKDEIQAKYIYQTKDGGVSRSYIFGYEKDDPSYECLKTKVFHEYSSTNQQVETLYTRNLQKSKLFFDNKVRDLSHEKLEVIFRTATQQFKYNVYPIDDELDVYVSFETMNNRGKQLSHLELLKNRLLYLTTLLNADNEDKNEVRRNINDCWKTVYYYLGKNSSKPLDDDEFLKNHWIMYFQYSRDGANLYTNFLLKENFTAKNVTDGSIEAKQLQTYVNSMLQSVKQWYALFNPYDTDLDSEIKLWLDKLNRLGYSAFAPLVMAALTKGYDKDLLVKLFEAMERYNFLTFKVSQRRSTTGDTDFYRLARQLYYKTSTVLDAVNMINGLQDQQFSSDEFKKKLDTYYKEDGEGFYRWNGLQYFLYEYELSLSAKSKVGVDKIEWNNFLTNKSDSIEHIYPRTATKECWTKWFNVYTEEQRILLRGSLGNLLALAQKKNSALRNDCFEDKKIQVNQNVGYFNGSYSENEVAQIENWTATEILKRGLTLLVFMEQRWNVSIPNKKILLFVNFLPKA